MGGETIAMTEPRSGGVVRNPARCELSERVWGGCTGVQPCMGGEIYMQKGSEMEAGGDGGGDGVGRA